MLWPSQQLHECQVPQLAADAGSQAYWLEQYAWEVLGPLPGEHNDAFGGQPVTQERLGGCGRGREGRAVHGCVLEGEGQEGEV